MNLTQLKQIINKNKSLVFIFGALLIEGLLILISLRIVKNYLTAQEYSDLTMIFTAFRKELIFFFFEKYDESPLIISLKEVEPWSGILKRTTVFSSLSSF